MKSQVSYSRAFIPTRTWMETWRQLTKDKQALKILQVYPCKPFSNNENSKKQSSLKGERRHYQKFVKGYNKGY